MVLPWYKLELILTSWPCMSTHKEWSALHVYKRKNPKLFKFHKKSSSLKMITDLHSKNIFVKDIMWVWTNIVGFKKNGWKKDFWVKKRFLGENISRIFPVIKTDIAQVWFSDEIINSMDCPLVLNFMRCRGGGVLTVFKMILYSSRESYITTFKLDQTRHIRLSVFTSKRYQKYQNSTKSIFLTKNELQPLPKSIGFL